MQARLWDFRAIRTFGYELLEIDAVGGDPLRGEPCFEKIVVSRAPKKKQGAENSEPADFS